MKKLVKKPKTVQYPRRAGDAYATQNMLYKVRDELKAHSSGVFHELKSDMELFKTDIKIEMASFKADIKTEMASFKADIKTEMASFKAEIKPDLETIKSELAFLKADVHRIALLVEEQNNRNKIVLDGMSHIFGRQDRLEADFAEFKK